MNSIIRAVLVAEGDVVAEGQRLAVVEAMKMHHEMVAGAVGLAVKPGNQVTTWQVVMRIEPPV